MHEHVPTEAVTRFEDAWYGSRRIGNYESGYKYEPILCSCGIQIKANRELTLWEPLDPELELHTDDTSEITCPHCGYVYGDSWEFSPHQEDGVDSCQGCNKRFSWQRSIVTTYTTWKEPC
jgi:hypothetical protein